VPLGVTDRAQEVALIARRHMEEHGTTAEQLAAVAMALRRHAAANPRALYREPLALDEYLAAPVVAAPLRTLDCAVDAAGACALVVTTRERARDGAQPAVEILASMQAVTPPTSRHLAAWFTERPAVMARGVAELFGRAGIGPADVDAAFFYDAFTPLVLVALEDFGFCARGAGGPFAAGGAIAWPAGRLPVNTNGGQLCEAHLDGVNNLLEAVRQLRGTATSQIEGAEVALVAGSALEPTGAVLLGRGR
jgi:acetyl-CoA acetyltransferase